MQPQILVNHIHFQLPDGKIIFNDLTLAFLQLRTGLTGKNGIGKSSLLKLILGELSPTAGNIQLDARPASLPQNPDFPADQTIAGFLAGDDNIETFYYKGLKKWLGMFGLSQLAFERQVASLSSGEITRLLLAKIFSSDADFLLLDEPTNHLDSSAREQLYHAIREWQGGLIVVSHDRTLLNLMDQMLELTSLGSNVYGGNYDAWLEQKKIEQSACQHVLNDAQKFMKKTSHSIQASREKHEQKQAYGKELRRSGSIDKLAANSKKGRSEKTQGKLLIKEERMRAQAETELQLAKEKMEINEEIQVDLAKTFVANGKMILEIEDLVFAFDQQENIIQDFSFKIQGPERIAITGDNGSGKTTLLKLILGELSAQSGTIYAGTNYLRYLDQNASLLNPDLSILENFMKLNPDVNENDAYRSLAQFLFRNVSVKKLAKNLSGGERMRAFLAAVLMSDHPPQLLILDEPTNHLDISSINSIESALNHYQGAMLVISHDRRFLRNIGIEREIRAPFT